MIKNTISPFYMYKKRIQIILKEIRETDCSLYLIIDKHLLSLISIYRKMEEELKTKAYSFKEFKKEEFELIRTCKSIIETFLMTYIPSDEEVVTVFLKTNHY